jgi:hypothetical protein
VVLAGNVITAAGAASLAPSLGRMTQLTSLGLRGTLCVHRHQLRCERLLASASNAQMRLRAVGCSGWWGLRGARRGAAVGVGNDVRADGAASLALALASMTHLTSFDLSYNYVEAAGAASLAPSLGRMTQLKSLELHGMLRAFAAAAL